MVMVLLLDHDHTVPLSSFLNELLSLFRYPSGSGRALLAGTLPLRYCAARFACKTPTWRLPVPGRVVDLVTANLWVAEGDGVEDARGEVHFVVQSRPRVWKRLHPVETTVVVVVVVVSDDGQRDTSVSTACHD